MHLGNEVLQHFLGHFEIGDHAVLQGANGGDIAGRTTQHALGLIAHRFDGLLAIVDANGNDGRFVQDDAPVAHIDQRIGRTQIYGEIIGEHSAQFLEH